MNAFNAAGLTRISAKALKLTSNGSGSNTAKVSIVARSGDVIDIPGLGPTVHDFAGMRVNSRIPIDFEHDTSIGYANRFSTDSGDLIVSGALVLANLTDDLNVEAIAEQIGAGVPWQASIEYADDMMLEWIPDGVLTNVNGSDITGPVYVVRDWELKAVAVCKFGVDNDTSVSIQLSEKAKEQTTVENKKGFFVRLSKKGNMKMSEDTKPKTEAVEAPVEAAPVEPVAAVEADVKAPEPVVSEVQAKAEEAAPVAAADKPAEVKSKDVEAEAVKEVVPSAQLSKAVDATDSRSEFRTFRSLFKEQAADYFDAGLTLSEATAKHLKFQEDQIAELKKSSTTLSRGTRGPVKFSNASKVAGEPTGIVKMAGR